MHLRNSAAIRGLLGFLVLVAVLEAQDAKVLEKEGRVMVTKTGRDPAPARLNMGLAVRDHLGTGEASRAVLQMSPRWLARVDEETDVEITPGAIGATSKDALSIMLGGIFVYSREEEGELKIVTPSATGGLRGTQLVVRVFPDGRTQMQVLEGEVDLANDFGQVQLRAGETGEAERGRAPRKTAVIEARNLLQWALYYPAVLSPDEFGLSTSEQRELAASLDAYRQGDLLGALDLYAVTTLPATTGAGVYRAAVLLATGRVGASRQILNAVPADHPGRRALERMLAAVQFDEQPAWSEPATAGEAMAESYYQQSRSQLGAALAAAQRATGLAPQSGFAWTRQAELEFSFGRTREALAALERGLTLTPRNAAAHALRGYLLSADNHLAEARTAFENAVGLDGGLGTAWLGLGLTKIKQGERVAGRMDLQTAATVEPNRSFFYSYHGKALALEGRDRLAEKDLALAKQTDPRDPTPWLYAAILAQQGSRYNAAIGEMTESLRLNDNRQVYRSRFLLDQDRAVRSTNLARIYQNNGMVDLSVREATRAVDDDYSNPSTHLFLANSLDALRDPQRLLLRYETAWFNELLRANLLAPVGGGPLSQYVSQQEYSRLLEADGFGGSLVTEARQGGYLDAQLSLYGTRGRVSSGVDYLDHRDKGTRPNNDTRHQELNWQLKFQATPDDTLYSLVKWDHQRGGDLPLTTDNVPGKATFRFEDKQEPGLLLAGWNHRWAPGVHTLFLGGRLAGHQAQTQQGAQLAILLRDPAAWQPGFLRLNASNNLEYVAPELRNAPAPPASIGADGSLVLSADLQRLIAPFLGQGTALAYQIAAFDDAEQRQLEIYSAELQQIWQTSRQTLVAGARWQGGEVDAQARLTVPISAVFTSPAAQQNISVDFGRDSLYAYEFFKASPALTLIAGATWDWLKRPENFRQAPLSNRTVQDERFSGKLGFTYVPRRWVTLRGAYTESLGGVSFDESVRLEPVQLAGFNQAYRTVISEALAGSVEAPVYKNLGLSLEGTLPNRTWWSASYNRLTEKVERVIGAFDFLVAPIFPYFGFAFLPAGTPEHLAYRETVWAADVNHLVGDEFALGANFRQTHSVLRRTFPQFPPASVQDIDNDGTLRELTLHANWNAPTGWFARAEAAWFDQKGVDSTSTVPLTANFWQFNAQVGHRFNRSQREISVGVLNLTDTDYRLSPITYTRPLARERTFFVRCRLGF